MRGVARVGASVGLSAIALCFPGIAYVATPGSLPQLTREDAATWRRIESSRITPDGNWFICRLVPSSGEGETEVVVRSVRDRREYHFAAGDATGGGKLGLGANGRWLAFVAASKQSNATEGRVTTKVIEVGGRRQHEFPGVAEFAFGGESGNWIALKQVANAERSTFDMLLRNLDTGVTLTLAEVEEFSLDASGRHLAWAGRGALQLQDLRTGTSRVLDQHSNASYRKLTWSDAGHALAALRQTEGSASKSIVAFTGVGLGAIKKATYDPDSWPQFPKGHEISSDDVLYPHWQRHALVWRGDERGLFFGVRLIGGNAQTSDASSAVQLRIWHWQDGKLPLQHKFEAEADRLFSYLSFVSLDVGRFVRLADSTVSEVRVQPRGRYALGYDGRAGERVGDITGIAQRDYYLIDLNSGERRRILSRWPYLPYFGFEPVLAPSGSHVVYYDEGNYFSYDVESGARRDLTSALPTVFSSEDLGRSLDKVIDGNLERIAGWTADGRYVLISDHWDIWALPLAGQRAINITGNGRRDRIRYRYRSLSEREQTFGATRIVDIGRPMYFRGMSKHTKQSGYARYTPGRSEVQRLAWGDAMIAWLQKAADAETFIYSSESAVQSPNYYSVSWPSKRSHRLTNVNPQQDRFRWSSGARLLTYVNESGEMRQAVLHLPADFRPNRRYPTVVSIYEELSDSLHQYNAPNLRGSLVAFGDVARYTQHGYAVLMPDIIPRANAAGPSALADVLAGVDAGIASGVVDAERLGLTGQSYGGYETSYIITQTSRFKAAVAVDQVADLVSASLQVYALETSPGLGQSNLGTGRINQPYFTGPWWQLPRAYHDNSPLWFAKNVTTPLLIRQNDQDHATQFFQGLEFFNTLRGMDKPVVLLQYVGKGHGSTADSQSEDVDFADRVQAFFDHFLKSAPAPSWWSASAVDLAAVE